MQGGKQFFFRVACDSPHVFEIDCAVFIEGCRESFIGRVHKDISFHRKGDRTVKDVRLDKLAFFRPFQGKDVAPGCIHQKYAYILSGIQRTVTQNELIVISVKIPTLLRIFHLFFCLITI